MLSASALPTTNNGMGLPIERSGTVRELRSPMGFAWDKLNGSMRKMQIVSDFASGYLAGARVISREDWGVEAYVV